MRWVVYYTLYRMDPQHTYKNTHFCTTISQIRKLHGPASIWEDQKHIRWWQNHTKNKYRENIFQKVALGYLLHFVQNGSPKNALEHTLLHNTLKNQKITRPGFHLGAPTKRKVMTTSNYIKYIGESSSRKLRWAIYCTLYRMDPQTPY